MEITLYKPKNLLLQQHIECFYTLTRTAADKPINYFTFPTNQIILSVDSLASIKVDNYKIEKTAGFPKKGLSSLLVRPTTTPLEINYECGDSNEITIYFKPLGINAFLEKPLSYYYQTDYPHFSPFLDFCSSLSDILSVKNINEKLQLLEAYWLSKLKGFEHKFLHQIIAELSDEYNTTTLTELAKKQGISRTTLNKQFLRHVCQTPLNFRKINRFRKAIEHFRSKLGDNALTTVTYKAQYFDQSHMTKDFKSLTNFSPRKFFTQLCSIEDDRITWLYL